MQGRRATDDRPRIPRSKRRTLEHYAAEAALARTDPDRKLTAFTITLADVERCPIKSLHPMHYRAGGHCACEVSP